MKRRVLQRIIRDNESAKSYCQKTHFPELFLYIFFDITKCHEKKSFAEEHHIYYIPTSWAFFFNFFLGAEIFELKVQRAMVRRPNLPNLLLYMFL